AARRARSQRPDSLDQSREHGPFPAWRQTPKGRSTHGNGRARWSSFIRTVTVGPGIRPGLLTPHARWHAGARGLVDSSRRALPPTAGGELHPALKTSALGECRLAPTRAF